MEQWVFYFEQYGSVWHILVNIILALAFLVIGNVIRRVIPFLRKAHIPSALIGGLLLFCFELILTKGCHFEPNLVVDKRLMQIITYHALAIGFIAMTLKVAKKGQKTSFMESVKNGAITGGTYMLQAGCGILVSLIFFWITAKSENTFFYDSGVLLPLGFGQGPGNALTWDLEFSKLSTDYGFFNFNGNGSVGLTIASIGFVVASVVSVIYINIFKHKNQIKEQTVNNEERNVREFIDFDEIEDSESVDKTSIQVGLVAIAYGLAIAIMALFWCISYWTKNDLFKQLAFGFNFIWGVITANLIKLLIKGLRKGKIIKKQYINNYQMDRISGFAFDMMIIAGVASIDINDVKNYWLFILVVCLVGAIVTLVYVRLMTKHCFKDFEHEAFLTNFGTLTGTASNGMAFLREIDPNYETPMSNIFIVSQLPAMIFVAPLLLLLGFSSGVSKGTFYGVNRTYIAMGIFFGLFILYTVFLILSPKIKFKKKEKLAEEVVE